jgi:hypothetical protein
MNFTLMLYFAPLAIVLLAVLLWALRGPRTGSSQSELENLEQVGRRNATYLPLIHQAMSPTDIDFLASRGSPQLARRTRNERRRIALSYLAGLHDDFLRLLHLAKVVAALSPEVGAAQESERLWLTLQFSWRYQMLRASLYIGLLSLPKLDALSLMVSELAVRMETAMNDLGERAVLAAKLARIG